MPLPLANVQTTDTFQTWLTRTNEIIAEAGSSAFETLTFTANSAPVSHSAGTLYYDGDLQSLVFFNNESELTHAIGRQQQIKVYNSGPGTIPKGKPVHITGQYLNCPVVELSDANFSTKVYSIGLSSHEIETYTYGYVTVHGVLRDIDTSGLTAGRTVHVAPGGGMQSAAPPAPKYAHEIGTVINVNAANGSVYVSPVQHYFEQLRVSNDIIADGDLTVTGNFSVLGSETITTLTNLEVDDTFVYLNGGDNLVANTSGVTGLNDLTFKGHYNGGNNVTFYVAIDSTGGIDTFKWSLDNFLSSEQILEPITGQEQPLRWGISVQFTSNTGHTLADQWEAPAAPVNVDTGWASNRNVGHAAGGYTHMGVFFDVSDERFKFFQSYSPSVTGNIDTGHASFEYGTVEANTYIGDGSNLTALNASQLTSGTVPVARLSGSGITLGTHTTGNYVATVANTDNNVTISGSGSETAAVSIGLADNISISGEITAQDVNSTSDLRLKMNVNPIEGALDKVLKLAGVEFDWVNNNKRSIGVVAQQVEEVLPELVHTNDSGYKSVSYGNLTALLIEAIKELKTIVDDK